MLGLCNVKAKDSHGNTPLHVAAKEGYLEIVELLIDKGASVHECNKGGNTPLNLAVQNGKQCVIGFMLDHGASYIQAHCLRLNAPTYPKWIFCLSIVKVLIIEII